MTLEQEIHKQLLAGQGLRFDASANALFRACRRKASQEAEDADKLAALDAEADKAEADEIAADVEKAKLVAPNLPAEPTKEEQDAYDLYESKFSHFEKEALVAATEAKEARYDAAKLRAYHETLGEQKTLVENPKRLLLRDIRGFIERNVGSAVCQECCTLIEEYLEIDPVAVLVKIKDFDGNAITIADADGIIVCSAKVNVTS